MILWSPHEMVQCEAAGDDEVSRADAFHPESTVSSANGRFRLNFLARKFIP